MWLKCLDATGQDSCLLSVHVLKFAKLISLSFFFKHVRVSLRAVKDHIFSFEKVNRISVFSVLVVREGKKIALK